MAASYPSATKSFTTKLAGQTVAAAHVNDLQDETVAVENALLTGAAHALKPSVSGAQDLGTASLFWGMTRTRGLQFDAVTTLTIAAGVVTSTRSHHAVDTEAAAATDDLDTITATGLTDGFVLVLRPADVTHVVTLKDGVGNLLLRGDCVLNATDRTITLLYDGTDWRELARSETAVGTMQLLGQGEGTNTSAAAANVYTLAISELTVKDALKVIVTHSSLTEATATVSLYNSTDSVDVCPLAQNGAVAAGVFAADEVTITPDQSANTAIIARAFSWKTGGGDAAVGTVQGTQNTFTTAWTGAWTLALRHGGVTATGTYRYRIAVYKILGQ